MLLITMPVTMTRKLRRRLLLDLDTGYNDASRLFPYRHWIAWVTTMLAPQSRRHDITWLIIDAGAIPGKPRFVRDNGASTGFSTRWSLRDLVESRIYWQQQSWQFVDLTPNVRQYLINQFPLGVPVVRDYVRLGVPIVLKRICRRIKND